MPDPAPKTDFKALAARGREVTRESSGDIRAINQLSAAERSQNRNDYARLWLAIIIIAAYTLSIFITLFWLGAMATQSRAVTVVDPYSGAMIDILKVVVLPVVTFMLGYYFGTGSNLRPGDGPKTDK